MINSLLILLVFFCSAIGYGLGSNQVSAPAMMIYTIAAIFALQISYLVTVFSIRHP
jgi:hypothetical protein